MMTSTDRNFHESPWTVSELIEHLQEIDGDSFISFSGPSGELVPKGFSHRDERTVSLDLDLKEIQ